MSDTPRITTRLALGWAKRRVRRYPVAPFSPLAADTTARILVVNTTGIGDTIFCTAPIADLRESFSKAHIAAFVDRRRVGLLADNPRLDEVIAYPGKFKKMRATIHELRKRNFDVAVIQHVNDPDVVPLIAMAGIKAIIGYENHTFSMLYALSLPHVERGSCHTLDSRLGLCRAVGSAGTHAPMELYPTEASRKAARGLLADLGVAEGTAIALNIGGSAPRKRWPATHWDALALLLSERGIPGIFMGGPEDTLTAEMIREHIGDAKNMHFAVGKLGLSADIALLTLCKAHISGDTGLMHAGFALDVPTVCLFGPNDPKWTGPHPSQQKAAVIQPDRSEWPDDYNQEEDKTGEVMKLISAKQVMDALDSLQ